MHMSDALVSAAVGTTMAAVSVGAVAYSVKKLKDTDLNNNKIPMMGVMGAFVFAAQMINFTIPGTGSSGHIGGGILLAALLGPYPAFLSITTVLIIQALLFADGGLLALGCNIFNMGVMTCFVAYPLIYKQILKKQISAKRLTVAAVLAVVIGLQLGAFAVVLETCASGIMKLPFTTFVLLMQPIHLAIGLVEGVVTGAVLCFVFKTRKEIITGALQNGLVTGSIKRVLIIFAVLAVVTGGFLSYYASNRPDGLEWAIQKTTGEAQVNNTSDIHLKAKELQDKTSVLPNYSFDGKAKDDITGTSISGILGGLVTLSVTISSGLIIMAVKKKRDNKSIPDSK